jgi:phenylacetate-CoA ligase
MIALWGPLIDAFQWWKRVKKNFANIFINNKKLFDLDKLTSGLMKNCIENMNRSKVKFILSYPSGLYELACFAEENHLKVNPLRSIMTSAEIIYLYMRETIERVFQCPVFNRYGSNEAGDIASECADHKGLHVSAYTHYVETIKEDGTPCKDGEQGEVVITLLTNFTMPLIRYKIGDMAVKTDEKCSCGKGLPMIKNVTGRTQDFFINKSGDLISGLAVLNPYFSLYNYIKKFQMIQESVDEIIILVVIDKDDIKKLEKDFPELKNSVKTLMGEDIKIHLKIVDQILPSPSNKYRFFISKVNGR